MYTCPKCGGKDCQYLDMAKSYRDATRRYANPMASGITAYCNGQCKDEGRLVEMKCQELFPIAFV